MNKKTNIRIASIVGFILLIPLFGNLFVDGWNWSLGDFIFAAIMLFGTGLLIDLVFRKFHNKFYRLIGVTIVILAFLVIWAELAVGLVEQLVSKI